MSLFKTKKDTLGIDEVITDLQTELKSLNGDSPEYAKMVDQLDKLYKIRGYDKPDTVSRDAALAVAGNLAGILLILGYEKVNVVASKAFGLIIKSRI